MTRIVAGAARGRRLVVPRGDGTRPTSDRVREALFSRLSHGGTLVGARVLDLYAGSGALGLEAASRGATTVVLLENARSAVDACRRNAAAVGVAGVSVVAASVEHTVAREADEPFDLVLLDPPYALAEDRLTAVLANLVDGGWLADPAVVVVERDARGPEPTWPQGLARYGERRYGETHLWFAEPLTGEVVA